MIMAVGKITKGLYRRLLDICGQYYLTNENEEECAYEKTGRPQYEAAI